MTSPVLDELLRSVATWSAWNAVNVCRVVEKSGSFWPGRQLCRTARDWIFGSTEWSRKAPCRKSRFRSCVMNSEPDGSQRGLRLQRAVKRLGAAPDRPPGSRCW